jgi:hypothetical protein
MQQEQRKNIVLAAKEVVIPFKTGKNNKLSSCQQS